MTKSVADTLKENLLKRLKDSTSKKNIKDFFYRNFLISNLLDQSNACVFEKSIYPLFLQTFDIAKRKKYTSKNPFSFNDDEDQVFIIPNKNKKILAYTQQNYGYLFIDEENYFSIRLIYQSLEEIPKSHYDHDRIKDILEECKSNYYLLIKYADTFSKYSDYTCGNKYVSRPSLSYFKDEKYNLRYYDKRDPGHVLTFCKHFGKAEVSPTFCWDYFNITFKSLIDNEYGDFK